MKKLFNLLLFSFVKMTTAFTNGTLLPSYLCGPPNDGFPKSLGDILKYFHEEGADLYIANIHQQNSTTPQFGLITVNKTVDVFVENNIYDLTLESTSGELIEGAIVYAEDCSGNKVGEFVEFGLSMEPFPACGPNNVGIVHNKEMEESIYTGIKWKAPPFNGCDVLNFKGLAVVDNTGFGFHSTLHTLILSQNDNNDNNDICTAANPCPVGQHCVNGVCI